MHTIQIILSALILMILFGLINLMMNYISRRDGEPTVPLRKKLWLIPLLSAFIIIPLELLRCYMPGGSPYQIHPDQVKSWLTAVKAYGSASRSPS